MVITMVHIKSYFNTAATYETSVVQYLQVEKTKPSALFT